MDSSASPSGDTGELSSEMMKIKKRDRKTISCTTCRKRKIKCDRDKPICGACKKNNVPTHLCVYDDTPWVSAVVKEQSLKNEIEELQEANERLNLLIKKRRAENETLQASYEEYISKLKKPKQEQNVDIKVKMESRDQFSDPETASNFNNVEIDLRKQAVFKYNLTKNSSRTFGALAWQSLLFGKSSRLTMIIDYYEQHLIPFRKQYENLIVAKETVSVNFINWRQVYHTLNIQKRYSSLVTDSNVPNKDDPFGKKLQELAKAMPSYKVVERKFHYFFKIKFASIIEKFFVEEEIKDDFNRIIRKTKKGGVEINVYTESRDYNMELVRLAGILLFIKFGIAFSEDDDRDFDTDNLIPKYALSCLYIGRAYIQPSLVILMVIIFLELLKYLNPDDVADELYINGSKMDTAIFLTVGYNIALSLGIANDFDKIPHTAKNKEQIFDTHLDKSLLQGIWLNLLDIDWKLSLLSGSSLVIPTFKGYDKTCSNKKLNHIGMMRKMTERYSILPSLFGEPFSGSPEVKVCLSLKRCEIEADLAEISTYFQDNVKSESKFWDHFKFRTMDTLPEKDDRVIRTLEVLDLTLSLSFILFRSYYEDYSDTTKEYSSAQRVELKNIANRYLNNVLCHASYMIKINVWFLNQVTNNEAVLKNRLLQVIFFPVLKRTLYKAVMAILSIVTSFSTIDEYGFVYNYDDADLEFERPDKINIFNYSLQEFDEMCFHTNVNNKQNLHFFTESHMIDFLHVWIKIYQHIKYIELMKKDIKWFITFRELFFGCYYLFQDKRKRCGNGKRGDPTKNLSLFDVFVLEEHLRFKTLYEDIIDPDRDYNRYTLNYILN